jgi:biotin-dependent carboxylase-like uncharacterized protein
VFDVVAPGPLTLLQDAGRPGFAHLGVTSSGAADRAAFAAANRLVGNDPGAACLETVFGGLELRARRTALVAVTGAPTLVTVTASATPASVTTSPAAPASAHDTASPAVLAVSVTASASASAPRPRQREVVQPTGFSFTVFAGERLTLAPPSSGLRNYLAVRGGFDAERILGSRSTDVLSGLGPPPVRPGDALLVSDDAREWPATEFVPPELPLDATITLRLTRGPRDDWFGDPGWQKLLATTWTIEADSNRIGLRISSGESAGTAIERLPGREGELASEGMVAGAVQIPPSGQPVVFLRDHPVTGGYPVIGVLTEAAIDRTAQLRPGDQVRLRSV